mmetsp:Transcript_24002/g.27647  ORF Transcript_24002/g.27647 Transcript_24002/m.27647 type:complete len:88 (-) Transcript_24002:191-454(-)
MRNKAATAKKSILKDPKTNINSPSKLCTHKFHETHQGLSLFFQEAKPPKKVIQFFSIKMVCKRFIAPPSQKRTFSPSNSLSSSFFKA